jgi:hypothetical protein
VPRLFTVKNPSQCILQSPRKLVRESRPKLTPGATPDIIIVIGNPVRVLQVVPGATPEDTKLIILHMDLGAQSQVVSGAAPGAEGGRPEV